MSKEFSKHERTNIAEMRPYVKGEDLKGISVGNDIKPAVGGWIARDPDNHKDQWYVAADYYKANFAGITEEEIKIKEVNPNGLVSFGEAVEALKAGKRVCRVGWDGKGLFAAMQVPSDIPKKTVPVMQSLPDSVKAVFAKRFKNQGSLVDIRYRNQLIIVYPDNTIYSWSPSTNDCLSDDWSILKD